MKETETIRSYEHAVKNISRLNSYRMKRGMTTRELSQLSGVSQRQIVSYESGRNIPTIRSYNKQTRVFGWRKISATTPRRERKEGIEANYADLIEPQAVNISCNPEYEFGHGKKYRILETERDEKVPVKDCVFSYEGKECIHHMFREVKGKWTRTYTDAQLVGKKIKEIDTWK